MTGATLIDRVVHAVLAEPAREWRAKDVARQVRACAHQVSNELRSAADSERLVLVRRGVYAAPSAQRRVLTDAERDRMVAMAREGKAAPEIGEALGRSDWLVRREVRARDPEAGEKLDENGRAARERGKRERIEERHADRIAAAAELPFLLWARKFEVSPRAASHFLRERGLTCVPDRDYLRANVEAVRRSASEATTSEMAAEFGVDREAVRCVCAEFGIAPKLGSGGGAVEVPGAAVAVRWSAEVPGKGRAVTLVSAARADCDIGIAELCRLTGAQRDQLRPGRVLDLTQETAA